MAATNINRVTITGNLTRDPELRALPSGFQICSLRIASNTRRKDNQSGTWVDKPNYFNITIFGAQGENAAKYLAKGRGVAVDGRLEWREWTDKDQNKRESIEIIADNVQFLSGPEGGGGGGGGYQSAPREQSYSAPQSDVHVDTRDFEPAPAGVSSNGHSAPTAPPADDDIPF